MADDIDAVRVICEGGLNTNENSLSLSGDLPGSATRLLNFEPSNSGGYRRINGFTPLDPEAEIVDSAGAEGPVLGVYGFYNSKKRGTEYFSARKVLGENKYNLYRLEDSEWKVVTLPQDRMMSGVHSDVVRVRFDSMNWGSGSNMFFVDGVNPLVWYDGLNFKEIKYFVEEPTEANPGGVMMLTAPSVMTLFKNHLVVSGDAEKPFIVAHSAPNDPTKWTAAAGAGQLYPGHNVVNIRPFRDELYVFGEERIRKMLPDQTAGFVLKDVTYDLGCIARDSLLEVGGNLIFLSQDGLRPVAGTDKINDVDLGLLTVDVQPQMDEIILNGDLRSFVGVVIKNKTQFRYFYNSEALAVEDSIGLLGAVRNSRRTGRDWEFAELLGIRAYSTWSGMNSGREVVIHGDYNGGVYRQEQGNSFNGREILSIYSTPYLDFGNTNFRKTLRTINTFVRFEGFCEILIGVKKDWGDKRSISSPNERITDFKENTRYDHINAVYDDEGTVYGDSDISVIKKNIRGSGFSHQFSFVSEGIFDPFVIQGFVVGLSNKGQQ